jgi:hypothetical protein
MEANPTLWCALADYQIKAMSPAVPASVVTAALEAGMYASRNSHTSQAMCSWQELAGTCCTTVDAVAEFENERKYRRMGGTFSNSRDERGVQ